MVIICLPLSLLQLKSRKGRGDIPWAMVLVFLVDSYSSGKEKKRNTGFFKKKKKEIQTRLIDNIMYSRC